LVILKFLSKANNKFLENSYYFHIYCRVIIVFVYVKIPKKTQDFLGKIEIKPQHSVVATLDAPQGAGKTRFFYFLMNEMASTGNKCLFISLEEHPLSELAQSKKKQYIKPKNRALIDTISELPSYQELCKIIENYDCIFIDSWGKMQSGQKLDFDTDLRKKFNGKLFFVIFQRTVNQTMRGGAAAQFDGDIIMKINKDKDGDFKQNYVYHDKNRYQSKDLNTLKFSLPNPSKGGALEHKKNET